MLIQVVAHRLQFDLGYIAGTMFGASSEMVSSYIALRLKLTTVTAFAITIIMMAAATHTDAQARVQEELDNVVGRTRNHTSLILSVGSTMQVVFGRCQTYMDYLNEKAATCNLLMDICRALFINAALILWAFCLSENPAAKIDTLAFSDIANIHATLFEICFTKRI
ncbi:uncharacterized protein HD556DRAFT_1446808 [Suillus plorans]|uniref:Uncharacterized protein n=1 Tax=Suillus plorans TaxID=116603 RepID=A0A9P7DDC8_9AGAM|nr:uncharacterized protein HD556DRAFT_1446808 [Suillus plorans]KAG1789585.1 hypothetical protein HD556DRAFT_1446808 [Suillus plorans]